MFVRTLRSVTNPKSTASGLTWLMALLLPLAPAGCGRKSPSQAASGSQREPEIIKMPARGATVGIVSVGDLLLGNASAPQLADKGYDWPFEKDRPLLAGADLVIGNLAAPITGAQ